MATHKIVQEPTPPTPTIMDRHHNIAPARRGVRLSRLRRSTAHSHSRHRHEEIGVDFCLRRWPPKASVIAVQAMAWTATSFCSVTHH
eukprot:scaffold128099_cov26-Cyclotella_meneghiniana.AAC.1